MEQLIEPYGIFWFLPWRSSESSFSCCYLPELRIPLGFMTSNPGSSVLYCSLESVWELLEMLIPRGHLRQIRISRDRTPISFILERFPGHSVCGQGWDPLIFQNGTWAFYRMCFCLSELCFHCVCRLVPLSYSAGHGEIVGTRGYPRLQPEIMGWWINCVIHGSVTPFSRAACGPQPAARVLPSAMRVTLRTSWTQVWLSGHLEARDHSESCWPRRPLSKWLKTHWPCFLSIS